MMSNIQDKLLAGLGALLAFQLVWTFHTNSKIDRLMEDKETLSQHWKLHNATKDKLNEVITRINFHDHADPVPAPLELFKWPDL